MQKDYFEKKVEEVSNSLTQVIIDNIDNLIENVVTNLEENTTKFTTTFGQEFKRLG